MRASIAILVIFVLTQGLTQSNDIAQPVIYSVQTQLSQNPTDQVSVSIAGETQIYIQVSNIKYPSGTTRVQLYNPESLIECPIQEDISGGNLIVCGVPPQTNTGITEYVVRVIYNRRTSMCQSPNSCKVVYSLDSTPLIQDIYPSSVVPDDTIYIQLLPRGDNVWNTYNARLVNVDNQQIIQNCEIRGRVQTRFTKGNPVVIGCHIQNALPGYYRVLVSVQGSSGLSQILPSLNQRYTESKDYDVMVAPIITGLSTSGQISKKGCLLKIMGKGLNDLSNGDIRIGKQNCVPDTQVQLYEEIQCLIQKKGDGGAIVDLVNEDLTPFNIDESTNPSWFYERWNDISQYDTIRSSVQTTGVTLPTIDAQGYLSQSQTIRNIQSNKYVERVTGKIRIPKSGSYKFMALSQGKFYLRLKYKDNIIKEITDITVFNDNNNKEKDIYAPGATRIFPQGDEIVNFNDNEIVEVSIVYQNEGQGDYFNLGLELKPSSAITTTPNRAESVQKLVIFNERPSNSYTETFTIDIINVVSGSFIVKIYDKINGMITQSNEINTQEIDTEKLKTELMSLLSYSGSSATVSIRYLDANGQNIQASSAVTKQIQIQNTIQKSRQLEIRVLESTTNVFKVKDGAKGIRIKAQSKIDSTTQTKGLFTVKSDQTILGEYDAYDRSDIQRLRNKIAEQYRHQVKIYQYYTPSTKEVILNIYFFAGVNSKLLSVETSVVNSKNEKVAVITTLRQASDNIIYNSIPNIYLRSIKGNNQNQLRIVKNGIIARCDTNCDLTIRSSNDPVLSSMDITQKNDKGKIMFNIENKGIAINADTIRIKVGNKQCIVPFNGIQPGTTDKVTCYITNPLKDTEFNLIGGTHIPEIHIDGYGYLNIDKTRDFITVTAKVTADTIGKTIGIGGFTDYTITGEAFGTDPQTGNVADVLVYEKKDDFSSASRQCIIKSVTWNQIICVLPKYFSTSELTNAVYVRMNIQATQTSQYLLAGQITYQSTNIPKASVANTEQFKKQFPLNPWAYKTDVTIKLQLDTFTTPQENEFELGLYTSVNSGTPSYKCSQKKLEVSGETGFYIFTCTLVDLDVIGLYYVRIIHQVNGQVYFDYEDEGKRTTEFQVEITSKITEQLVQQGNKFGGTILTFNGVKLPTQKNNIKILTGSQICDVTSATATQIKCVTRSHADTTNTNLAINIYAGGIFTDDTRTSGFIRIAENLPYEINKSPAFRLSSNSLSNTNVNDDVSVDGVFPQNVKIKFYQNAKPTGIEVFPQVIFAGLSLSFKLPVFTSYDGLFLRVFDSSDNMIDLVNAGAGNFQFTQLGTLSPTSVSRGGAVFTIKGNGVDSNPFITIDNEGPCVINNLVRFDASTSSISCYFVGQFKTTGQKTLRIQNSGLDNIRTFTFTVLEESSSPIVNSISSATSTAGSDSQITIDGSGFTPSSTRVWFQVQGSTSAQEIIVEFSDVTTSRVTLTVSKMQTLSIGKYNVLVLTNKGFAVQKPQISFTKNYGPDNQITITLDNQVGTTLFSSYLGGASMKLKGQGLIAQASVPISARICNIQATAYLAADQIVIQTPAYSNKEYTALQFPNNMVVSFDPIADSTPTNGFLFADNDENTFYTSTNSECWVGFDLPSDFRADIDQVQFSLRGDLDLMAQDFEFKLQTSVDSTTYKDINTRLLDNKNLKIFKNIINVGSDNINIKSIRLIDRSGKSKCQIADFSVTRARYFHTGSLDNTEISCPVELQIGTLKKVITSQVRYSPQATGRITTIPTSTFNYKDKSQFDIVIDNLGKVTLQNQITSVKVSTTCSVIQFTKSDQITLRVECNPSTVYENDVLSITSVYGNVWTNGQVAQFGEELVNQQDWQSEIRHINGNDLLVPKGKTLYMTKSPKVIKNLVIEGTLLIKKEITSDINIRVSNIIIRDTGKFIIGDKDDTKTTGRVIIQFLRDDQSFEKYDPMNFIVEEGGTLLFQGRKYNPIQELNTGIASPERLQDTISVNQITLKSGFGTLKPGNKDIIVTCADISTKCNEIITLKVDSETSSNTLNLDTTQSVFRKSHIRQEKQYGNKRYEVKLYVGLLTRDIEIYGQRLFNQGVTIKARNPRAFVLDSVRIKQAGKGYGINPGIHIQSTGINSQIRVIDSVIEEVASNGIVLQGVQAGTLDRNIIQSTYGSAITLLGQSEINNQITNNLLLNIKGATSSQLSNPVLSGIYVASPRNIIKSNIVIGCSGHGFTYFLRPFTFGFQNGELNCPQGDIMALTTAENSNGFDNNYVLNSATSALFINEYKPRKYSCLKSEDTALNPPVQQTFSNLNALKNSGNGVHVQRGVRLKFDGLLLGDNLGTEFKLDECESSGGNNFQLVNSYFVGYTGQGVPSASAYNNKAGIQLPYTKNFEGSSLYFYEFPASTTRATIIDPSGQGCVNGRIVTFSQLQFDGTVDNKKYLDLNQGCGTVIQDTTQTLYSGNNLVYNYPHLKGACATTTSPSVLSCSNKLSTFQFTELYPDTMIDKEICIQRLSNADSATVTDTQQISRISTNNQKQYDILVSQGNYYSVRACDQSQIYDGVIQVSDDYLSSYSSTILRFDYSRDLSKDIKTTSTAQLNPTNSQFGSSYYNTATNQYFFAVNSPVSKIYQQPLIVRPDTLNINFKAFDETAVTPPPPPTNTVNSPPTNPPGTVGKWEVAASWSPKYSSVPTDQSDIEIPLGKQILVDDTTAFNNRNFKNIDVQGELYIQVTQPTTITIEYLKISKSGKLVACEKTKDVPLTIIIKQISTNTNSGQIDVQGQVILCSKSVSTSWSYLTKNINPSTSSVGIQGKPGWLANKQIVVTPTRIQSEYDEVTIQASSDDGADTAITTSGTLNNFHYGASSITINDATYGTLDMRAQVIYLDRLLRIKSDGTNKCSINVKYDGTNTLGKVFFDGIMIEGCGTSDGYIAALNFIDHKPQTLADPNSADQQVSVVQNSLFFNGKGPQVKSTNSNHVKFIQNVIYKTNDVGIELNGVDYHTFSNNIIQRVTKDKSLYPVGLKYSDSTYKFNYFEQLVIGGVQGAGYIILANKKCSDADTVFNMKNTLATFNYIGYVVVSNTNEKCQGIHQLKAIKSTFDGIYFYDIAESVKARRCVVSDNRFGLGLSASNDDRVNVNIDIEDSFIIGQGYPKDCASCYSSNNERSYLRGIRTSVVTFGTYNVPQLTESFQTYVIQAFDSSVITARNRIRRLLQGTSTGSSTEKSQTKITTATTTRTVDGKTTTETTTTETNSVSGFGKSSTTSGGSIQTAPLLDSQFIPKKIYYEVMTNSVLNAKCKISNTKFMNYEISDNQLHNYAIVTNEWATDFTPPYTIENVEVANVNRKIYIHQPSTAWAVPEYCGSFLCTGLQNVVIQDKDGDIIAQIGQTIQPGFIISNNAAFLDTPKMQQSSNENVMKTIDGTNKYGILNIDNLGNVFSSEFITSTYNGKSNKINIFRNRNGRMNRYKLLNLLDQEIVIGPQTLEISPLSYLLVNPPSTDNFQIIKQKGSANKFYFVKSKDSLNIQNPQKYSGVAAIDLKQQSKNCGTNILDGVNNEIKFVLSGQSDCSVLLEQHDGYLVILQTKRPEKDYIDSNKREELETQLVNKFGQNNVFILGTKEIVINNEKHTEVEIFSRQNLLTEAQKKLPEEVSKDREVVAQGIIERTKPVDANAVKLTVTPRYPLPAGSEVAQPKTYQISGATIQDPAKVDITKRTTIPLGSAASTLGPAGGTASGKPGDDSSDLVLPIILAILTCLLCIVMLLALMNYKKAKEDEQKLLQNQYQVPGTFQESFTVQESYYQQNEKNLQNGQNYYYDEQTGQYVYYDQTQTQYDGYYDENGEYVYNQPSYNQYGQEIELQSTNVNTTNNNGAYDAQRTGTISTMPLAVKQDVTDMPAQDSYDLHHAKSTGSTYNPWVKILDNVEHAMQERNQQRTAGGYQYKERNYNSGFDNQLGGNIYVQSVYIDSNIRLDQVSNLVLRRIEAQFDMPPDIRDNVITLLVYWGSSEGIYPWYGAGTVINPIWDFSDQEAYLPNSQSEPYLELYIYSGNDYSNKVGETKVDLVSVLGGQIYSENLYKDGELVGEIKFDITRT